MADEGHEAMRMRYLGRNNQQQRRRAVAIGHHRRVILLLLDSGRTFMLLGIAILIHELLAIHAAAPGHAEPYVLVAYHMWLLGVSLVMLSLVAGQFPHLCVAAAAIAMKLRNYLLGGL